MPRSTTKIIDMDQLARDPVLGSVLVRLMMVMNDVSVVHDSFQTWKDDPHPKRKARRNDALRYFIGLQVSHVYEGLDTIVSEIERSPELLKAVDLCSIRTRSSYRRLIEYRATPEFNTIMGRVRNNLVSHYDARLAKRSVIAIARKRPHWNASISLGTEVLDWRFQPAEIVRDRIGVREIFRVPEDQDPIEASDKIVDKLFEIFKIYADFAGYFIWETLKSA